MQRERGFSLVEMIVVLAIMAILLGLGMGSYRTYMANQKVQSTAEVFMSGLQMARGEAVKLNRRVEFILTDEAPVVASVDTATPTTTPATGRNWIVRGVANAVAADIPSRALAVGGNTFVEGKSGAEGSGTASSAASPISLAGSIAAVSFDGFGSPVGLTTTATFQFSNLPAGACVADGGPVRCLVVRMSRGGQTRLCDPAVPATDTRSCGT